MAVAVADAVSLTAGLTQEEQFINGLAQGGAWTFSGAPRELTYSLHTDGGPWSVASAAALIQAFQAWADVADLDFRLIISAPETELSSAELAITLISDPFTDVSDTAGIGIFPDPAYADELLSEVGISRVEYPHPEGDLFFYGDMPDFDHVQPGGRGYADYLHEIGHALGLKHPHDDGGNGRPTFAETGMSADDAWDYDSGYWTLMSYYDPAVGSPGLESGYQATPMPLDILVIQHIYGANLTFHAGDDTYRLAADGQVKTIWDAGGSDTLDASGLGQGIVLDLYPGAFTSHGPTSVTAIAFGVSIENAIGTAFDDELWGNDADNRLEGRDGDDILYADLGVDTLVGGWGDDYYILFDLADSLIEAADAGDDSVLAPFTFTLAAGGHVENILLDEGGDFDATGNELDNLLSGNSGANVLSGGAGDDYYIIDALDSVIELPGEGLDTVLSTATFSLIDAIENLILDGTDAADATGNRLDNILVGNTGDNVLNGGRGWDVLDGDTGNDTYRIDQPGDRLSEATGAGTDLVETRISHALGANFENLTLAEATGNLDGIGNAQANTLTGNAGSNALDAGDGNDTLTGLGGDDVLLGGAGNDSLTGGLGQDLLSGGAGNDHFRFDTPAGIGGNADVISDFTRGQDRLVFDNGHYSALGAAGGLGAGQFLAGVSAGAQDTDDHLLYDSGTGELYYDPDGAGFDPALLIATLTGKPALTAADILVVA